PGELNGVDGDKIYTIQRATYTSFSMFKVGSGKLTFADITLDGNGASLTASVTGAVVSFAATGETTDTVVFDRGTTVQNSKSNASGGVVYAAYGHVVMNDGAVIRDCIGQKGAAIFLGMNNGNNGKTYATFTMNGGIITGCKASHISGTSHGAAVYMEGAATFTMKGGLIAGNISERTSMMSGQEEDVFIDGAVGFIRGQQCKVYLSGDATIRNNYGKIKLGSAYSNDLYFGADLVLHADHRSGESLNIAAGFTGSVGVSFPTTGKIANVATDYEVGTVLNGIVDANTGNVAKVTASGTLKWAPAEAEVDVNGKVMRYETVDEAYAVAGSENPIKLVSDATITVLDIGDTAKIVENGYSLIVKSNGSFEKSEGEEISFGTITFKGEEFAGETLTAVTYTITEGGQITNVALSAGTDLSLYFYANMGSRFADSVLRVTRGSNTTELTSTYDEALGLYRFVYSDIAPQCAGDAISVELVNGEDVLFTYDNYSILSYCQQVLAMDAASLGFEEEKCEELKTLLRDLLTYCASAQTYLGYNTDALVNEGIKGSTFVLPAYTPKSTAVHNKVEGVTFTLAGLRFYNVNNLWFEFTTTDPAKTTVDINGKIYTSDSFVLQSGNTYRVYAEDLYAIQFDQAFVAKLSFDGTLLQTLHYSVGAYVHSLVTAEEGEYTEAAINLAKATYNYGVAARIWADRYAATTHTAGTLVSTHGANTLGGAAIKNGVLVMDQPASGIEFTFRGKGDVVLNLTAEEAARIEVMVDGQVLPHFLVSAGTADYTVKTGLADGKHTVRIVQENGAVTLNSANVKGYFTAPEAQTKDLFIEFVGSDALLGHNLFLNYSSYEDDATGAYAVLAARELGARYLISDTDKVFAATADAPDLVVIDFENGFDYTDLLADIRAAYGAGVEILFVGCVEQISAMDESFINLTKDTSGIDEYPSAGGAAIQGAELAKHIRESYDFFTADEIAEAKKDIIVEVTSTNATSGYNPFYVYIRTSDPSGKYYIRYNFTHQYDINRTNYNGSSTTNISNFRILGAHLVEVTDVNENAVTCNPVLYVLGTGEISTALKTMSNTNGTSSGDFTGGLHGDEWIRGVDGTDGHLTDAGWIPAVALLADGVEIDIVGGEAKVITCNTLTFDQTTMMYEWGTSSNDPTDDIEKRGTPLVIHTQHFTITQESGIQNRQSYTWLKDVGIDTSSNYLLMFTMNRFDGAKDVCTEMEVFNTDCVSNGTESAFGKLDVSSISVLHNATSRFIHYGGDSGVTSYARYDLCNVGKFSDNSVTLQDIWVSIRNGESSADNKLYVRFKSSDGEANKVAEGDFWTLDVAYNIDYVNPNN
ncbi:MAG: hypothetical protein J6D16_01300, partial [Clostridia bacterium]|nr:hypothetical protein [Clostridia bacterium]